MDGRTKKNRRNRRSLEEDRTIIPSAAVQKHAVTQEGIWKGEGGQRPSIKIVTDMIIVSPCPLNTS